MTSKKAEKQEAKVKEKALHIKDVSVAYGHQTVIQDINLDIEHGETFGLMGLNGVGKTTLIKAILGLREYKTGTIRIDGLDRLDIASKKKISYLPERFDPPWFLKGIEFLKFSMKMYDAPFDEERVFKFSDSLLLDHNVLSNKVQTYSKGMRQKLGLLATMLSGASVLILDEPMSGLDPRARALVKDAIHAISEEGRTVFLCSHILSDMTEMCDRVSVMHNSRLLFTGKPAELEKKVGNDNLERAFLALIDEDNALLKEKVSS